MDLERYVKHLGLLLFRLELIDLIIEAPGISLRLCQKAKILAFMNQESEWRD